jgi:cytochrome c peroxidase
MNQLNYHGMFLCLGLGAALSACDPGATVEDDDEPLGVAGSALSLTKSGSYNLHLEDRVRFNAIQPGADAERGRALFGIAADLETEDKSGALFEGPSAAFGGVVVSNQRTCFTCHRGLSTQLGFLPPPLSDSVPLTDALFTGIDGDAQGDPDGLANLDNHALIKYRPGRFNLQRPQSDPFRRVFFWRKSIKLVNTAFGHGFLNDGRMRVMLETDRGAVFSHTQDSDERFDDLFSPQQGADLEAFQFTVNMSDPALAALRDPNDPMFQTLVNDPFYTVAATTPAQKRGQKVFEKSCMTCHNTPNVFSNLANVEPVGNGERTAVFPAFGPNVGRNFNVGVSERNKHGLRFTADNGDGTFETVVLPLANEDGSTNMHTVTFDVGLAATTARSEDIGRFKVPQLRRLKDLAPYFHDNSADTIEEVVDYFNSDHYNHSKDGKRFPIHLNANKRADLIEFLNIL